MPKATEGESLLRLPAVKERTGLSKTEIYRRIQQGRFPAHHRVSHRVSVWLKSEIDGWVMAALLAQVDPEAAALL